MGKQTSRSLIVYLPLVLVATFLVLGAPMLLVIWLRASGTVTSIWAGTAIGVVASFLASYAGGRFWKTRGDARDLLFSDLMLWGWVKRWRSERRLVAAADLLGLTAGGAQAVSSETLTNEQKARLLTRLTSGLEARDPYTHGHSRRVARHASDIAKHIGLSSQEVAKIRAAGAMHDVGKLETPIAVLHKEGRLTDEEYSIVKRHPVDGAVMVAALQDDELTAMVRHHHERLDGKGYPDGLAGEAIPIGARILAVADTFDAITSTRPYRHATAHKKALDILVAEASTQLDPDAVRAFSSCYSGRRPLAYWTILANGRPRLTAWLGGGLGPANAATAAKVMVGAATAAAVSAGAVVPLSGAAMDPSRVLADDGVSQVTAQVRSRSQAPASQTFRRTASDSKRPLHPADRPRKENAGGQTHDNQRSRRAKIAGGGQDHGRQVPEADKVSGKDTSKSKDTETGQEKVKVKAPGGGKEKAPGGGKEKALGGGKEKAPGGGKNSAQNKGSGQAPAKGQGKEKAAGQQKDKGK